MNKLWAISIVTGEIFSIMEEDIPVLFNYQIPLKKIPNHNCNKCYGRGWTCRDSQNNLHVLCKCVSKCITDDYKISEKGIVMPKFS
jgi:hypothetical protein